MEPGANANQPPHSLATAIEAEAVSLRTDLRETEERLRLLFDQTTDAIIIADACNLTILELNPPASRLLGATADDPGQNLRTYWDPTIGARDPQTLQPGERAAVQLVRRDGATILVEVQGALISRAGRPVYQFILRETTEKTELESQLRSAEKLASLGQMVSGVAHELTSPLSVIKGYVDLILARHSINEETRDDLNKVARESERATKLIRNFLSYSREQTLTCEKTDINELVRKVAELKSHEFNAAEVELQVFTSDQCPETLGDPDKLQQALMNLLQNALHAVVQMPLPRLVAITTEVKGATIHLAVQDNGPGVAPEAWDHLFEPFFTTKPVGTGSGLGLSITHAIMTDHHGRVTCDAVEPHGARFTLEIPLLDSLELGNPVEQLELRTLAPSAPVSKRAVTPAKILVLDDEPSISGLLAEMLEMLGHSATTANRGHEALELIAVEEFDVILSDFRMPRMNGRQFYEAAVQIQASIAHRIVFLTGDLMSDETQNWIDLVGAHHLAKPFHFTNVQEVVAKILRRNGRHGEGKEQSRENLNETVAA